MLPLAALAESEMELRWSVYDGGPLKTSDLPSGPNSDTQKKEEGGWSGGGGGGLWHILLLMQYTLFVTLLNGKKKTQKIRTGR